MARSRRRRFGSYRKRVRRFRARAVAILILFGAVLACVALDPFEQTTKNTARRPAKSKPSNTTDSAPRNIALDTKNPAIDVLLTALDGEPEFTFSAPSGWIITNEKNDEIARTSSSASATLGVSPAGGYLLRGGIVDAESLTISSIANDPIKVANQSYRGKITIRKKERGLSVINTVPLEEYLGSVVGSEMYASTTPLSALEAQAVIARTYARWAIEDCGRRPIPDSVEAQAYLGVGRETALTRKAVENTQNLVLTWNGRLLPAFYHSTCGGSTIDGTVLLGSPAPPPLRGGPCGYCEGGKLYRWNISIKTKSLAEICGSLGIPGTCRAVDPAGPAGDKWSKLKLRTQAGEIVTSARTFRNAILKNVKGLMIPSPFIHDVAASPDGIRVTGRGFGHGVGLCQIGAAEMSRRSYNTNTILQHYYPSAELGQAPEKRLVASFDNKIGR
ncbi:MAG: SpoIID/LytB domain-containing protein [Planctomycetota bacterium]